MLVHVIDQRTRVARAHRQRHAPIEHESIGQVGQDDHVRRIADVQLVLLLDVVRQLEVDALDGGGKAAGVVAGDHDGGQAHVAGALQARREDHLVGLRRGLDAIGLDAGREPGDHLAIVARVGRVRHGHRRHRPVGLVDVDDQDLANLAAARDVAPRAAEQLGGGCAHIQARAVGIDRQVGELAGERERGRDGDHVDHLVQRARTRVDVDHPHRAAGGHVEVAAKRVERHRGRVGRSDAVEHEVDQVDLRRGRVLVHRAQPDAVDHRHGRRQAAFGVDEGEGARQVGAGLGGCDAAPEVDGLDHRFVW